MTIITLVALLGCQTAENEPIPKQEAESAVDITPVEVKSATGELSDEQIEEIVRRSYQYVAMFNVIQKFALDPASGGLFMDGFNKPVAATVLTDHNLKSIARPNNDTLYQGAVLDLRLDPVIIEFPVIDSKYVVFETSGYDHYVGVPLASTEGDFKKPTKILFYTDRTEGYHGEEIKGVDRFMKVDVKFPAYGKSEADVFADNLLEVMQFVFNHTTFDPNNAMDQAILAAYKPLGVEPEKMKTWQMPQPETIR